MTDKKNVIPATPITPLPTPPVGMPRVPVTLFNVWTWNSPVIPQFYWNVYSAEQRIKEICKQIGKIGAYLDYAASKINEANVDMIEQINKINSDISEQIDEITKKLTEEVTRLEGLITAEAEAREAADTALRNDLDAEEQARTAADAKLTSDLKAEVKARQDADETLHTELSAETTARTHADDQLHTEISNETQSRTTADTEIKASVTQEVADRKAADDALGKRIDAADAANAQVAEDLSDEVAAREAADTALQGKLDTETRAREAADTDLQNKITAEVTARGEAISALTTRVANEESNRQSEDGKLGARIDQTNAAVQNNAAAIVTETKARDAADNAINASLATKLVRDDLRASGKITLTPGEGNTVTIGDTFEADFSALQSAISGLQSALASETSERRHDDAALQTAVDARLERGKLLAGEGIEVTNDPDQSTVTVSAKVTDTDLADVTGKVTTAQQTADAAKSVAQTASSKAGSAYQLADDAQLAAKRADGKAENAIKTASDAANTADAAQGDALSARNTANQAKNTAETAHEIANRKLEFVSVRGGGLTGGGRPDNPLTLAAATASTLGGIKVGSGLTVTEDGTLSATAQGGSGLSEVAHDSSLKGTGASGSPLGVVAAPQGALTAGEQGLTVNAGEGLSISDNKLVAEVTQAELTAVEGKADAAQNAATEAGSKADAATEAATQASSKAEAAKTAADQAAAAVAAKGEPVIKELSSSGTVSSTGGLSSSFDLSRPAELSVYYQPLELRIKFNDRNTFPSNMTFESCIVEKADGKWWGNYRLTGADEGDSYSIYVLWGYTKNA